MKGFCRPRTSLALAGLLALGWQLPAGAEAEAARQARAQRHDAIEQAARAGLEPVLASAAFYPRQRTCFSCHHQTLPMLAMVEARRAGLLAGADALDAQREFTHAAFTDLRERLQAGRGIGGRAMTVGYGLWAMDLGAAELDDTTEAMVAYLLDTQEADGSFWRNVHRPPLEDSQFMSTVLSAYYLQLHAAPAQTDAADAAVEAAVRWLDQAEPVSQEDHNARMWGLRLFGAEPRPLAEAIAAVLTRQRPDGGWAQLADMDSDAYATGQTLFLLRESGLHTPSPAWQRGIDWLLDQQQPDGTWHVRTRSHPVQEMFDAGFPHDKDQFISISATSWAAAALAAALPDRQPQNPQDPQDPNEAGAADPSG